MSTTTVRMDDDLKAEVNAILDSMGLNFNTFVNMAERHGVESEPGLRWCCRTAQGVARWRIIMIFRN